MQKLKVAIVEDNPMLLKALRDDLNETGMVEVVAYASNSGEFISKVRSGDVNALVLDIDLHGDSMSGIDLVQHLRMPALFVTGKSRDYLDKIEGLNLDYSFPVYFLTKPAGPEKLRKILEKFITATTAYYDAGYINLDFKGSMGNKILTNDIVYLCSSKDNGAASNNKEIFFCNRKPELLVDFSFTKMEKFGLPGSQFITTHGSYRVNLRRIEAYVLKDNLVRVSFQDGKGAVKNALIPVSDNYRSKVKNILSRHLLL